VPHRATLYNVRIYPRHKRKPPLRPLGDFDTSGTKLTVATNSIFKAGVFASANNDGTRSVVCEKSSVVGDEVHSIFASGQSGYVADIVDANQQLRLRQDPTDSHLMRCASVLRLEPNETLGWWAVHVNNGRGAKGLVEKKLLEVFRDGYEDLTLKVTPVVRGADLAAAVDQGRIDKVTLVRLERPKDRARVADTGKWVPVGRDADILLEIKGKGEQFLMNNRVTKFLKTGDRKVFDEIIEFEGMHFDKAKVQVTLGNGDRRTFNIEEPDSGHAFSVDLDDDLDVQNGEPTEASLFGSLQKAIDLMTT
jgi:hypothetical protein